MKFKSLIISLVVASFGLSLAGCTFIFQTGRRSDVQKIEQLSKELDELNQTKRLLEDRLSQEIKDKQVSLKMMEKGLVIDFVADVLFDSGKAKIKQEAYPILDKVAKILKENVPELSVGIEGHTDNVPIARSNWKSNWELSTARALSVLHYMESKEGISPERLSAVGYGEYRPVASNDTAAGRKMNRRVEVVILPKITKVSKDAVQEPEQLQETSENLK
ncbi:MAG: OmpA family protein [Candidatus Omnitrophica bacterium]|nr:OmpA family protein [Candidatus Omnitrophota bacterium]